MRRLYSTELKALVAPVNILEVGSVLQDHSLTVQEFDYDCLRRRNNSGEAFGPTEPVILDFKVRVNNPADARPFYKLLAGNDHVSFTFLFNASFNEQRRLKDYEDGMVADGFVVSLEEDYSAGSNGSASTEQMLLNVRVLLVSNTYLGRERNYQSIFINPQ